MKNHYSYKCFNCSTEYTATEIEDNLIYLCPKCGRAEKNQPLKGVLEVVYDYNSIKDNISREIFLTNVIGKILDYSYLWPIEYNRDEVKNISTEDKPELH